MDLVDIVCAVFVHQGFSVVSAAPGATQGAVAIVVRRGPLEIAIAVVPGSIALGDVEMREILATLSGQVRARHLIAYAGHPPAAARGAAADAGAVLWDRERLMAEAGAAFVETADPDPFPDPLDGGAIGGAPPNPRAQGAVRGWGGPAGPQKRSVAPARSSDIEAVQGAVPLRVEERAARATAERLLKSNSLRALVEWVPFFLLDFHLEVAVRTPRGEEALLHSGTLIVSASGGEVEDLDGPLEVVPAPAALTDDEYDRALGRRRLSVGDARDRARAFALASVARTVEHVKEGAGVVVTERHEWRPRGSHVDLVVRGLWLVPLWLVDAEHGLASISGATGRALRVAPFAGDRPASGA